MEMRRSLKASAVEMEGAAVAQVSTQLGVPFLVIRSITDSADGSTPDGYRKNLDAAPQSQRRYLDVGSARPPHEVARAPSQVSYGFTSACWRTYRPELGESKCQGQGIGYSPPEPASVADVLSAQARSAGLRYAARRGNPCLDTGRWRGAVRALTKSRNSPRIAHPHRPVSALPQRQGLARVVRGQP